MEIGLPAALNGVTPSYPALSHDNDGKETEVLLPNLPAQECPHLVTSSISQRIKFAKVIPYGDPLMGTLGFGA